MKTHVCPGCRKVDVPDSLLSCLDCWRVLPYPVRLAVSTTVRLSVLSQARRDAIEMAINAWKAQGIRPS